MLWTSLVTNLPNDLRLAAGIELRGRDLLLIIETASAAALRRMVGLGGRGGTMKGGELSSELELLSFFLMCY